MKKMLIITGFILSGLLVLFVIGSTINNKIGNCKVEGDIKGLGTTVALVSGSTNSSNQKFFKLILIWNNKFSFNAGLAAPGGGRILTRSMFFKREKGKPLSMRSKMVDFYLNPNESITIVGRIKPYSIDYTVKGNIKSEQLTQFRQQNLELLEEETRTALKLNKIQFAGANRVEIDKIQSGFDSIREKYNHQRLKYAIANPAYEISASFLQSQEKAKIIKYFPALADKVKQTPEGRLLQERIEAWEQMGTGKPAPIFASTTLAGTAFSLSDLKGKYVVVDFWGSWCGPCIKGFPQMKEYYNKYQDRLEIVGIAYGDSEATWRKAVEKHNLQWPQLLNREEDNILIKYTVEKFPTKILIDTEGNLVQMFEGESHEFYQKLDELFNERNIIK